ncbi:MAG: DUF3592 domain-containing protein [Pseudomonadota bacterium]
MTPTAKHDRDQPRSWFSLFWHLGGWIAVLAAFAVVWSFGYTFSSEQSAARFAAEGRTTFAEVMDHRVRVSRDGDGNERRTYFVTFAYSTRDGTAYEVEKRVRQSHYHDLPIGARHEIRYLSTRPERIEAYVGEGSDRAMRGLWLGGVAGAIGLAALAIAGGRANRAVLARRDGVRQVATVVRVRELWLEVNDTKQARLVWTGPDGVEGESLSDDVQEFVAWKPGDRITVYRRGKSVWWEGDVGPRRSWARDL